MPEPPAPPGGPLPAGAARAVGYVAAGWCLGFAAVSAWQVAAGPAERYAADASGLAILIVLVGVLKLVGAAVALAAVLVRPGPRPPWPVQLLGVALWGAFGVLAVWFHRRHHLRWPAAVAGLAGAPLLLGLVLAAAPAALDRLGLLPT